MRTEQTPCFDSVERAWSFDQTKAFCYIWHDKHEAMYQLLIRKQAIKALQRMLVRDAKRIRGALDELAEDPSRQDNDVKPLRGRPGFRMRVGGYRVIFERDDKSRVIEVLGIGPRGDVYK